MSPSMKKSAKSAAKKAGKKGVKKAGTKAKTAKPKPKKKVAAKKAKSAKAAPKKHSAKKATKGSAKKSTTAPAKKTAPKKVASKADVKKADVKATAKSAAKSATKTTPKSAAKTSAKKASKAAVPTTNTSKIKGKAAKGSSKPAKRSRPRKLVTPTGPRHPKLGYKWICYECDAKFYDLGKEEPICPKCEADQRERPPADMKSAPETPKPKVVRPMAQLLDDEDPAANREEEVRPKNAAPTEKEMFDASETDDGLDIDDADVVNEGHEPPEIDAL